MNFTPHHQYITNWHDSFVEYIGSLLGVVAGLMARSEATEEDKRGLEGIRLILNGRDAVVVERDLAAGVVKRSTLDKIAKLNKDLADTCFEHIQMNPLVREFWKQMVHIKIECDKAGEQERLAALQIRGIDRATEPHEYRGQEARKTNDIWAEAVGRSSRGDSRARARRARTMGR